MRPFSAPLVLVAVLVVVAMSLTAAAGGSASLSVGPADAVHPAPLPAPSAVAPGPSGGAAPAAYGATISTVDLQTGSDLDGNVESITSGGPQLIAFDPASSLLFGTNTLDAFGGINVTTGAATNGTLVPGLGSAIVFDPVTGEVYVGLAPYSSSGIPSDGLPPGPANGSIAVFDGSTGAEMSSIDIGMGSTPRALALNASAGILYVAVTGTGPEYPLGSGVIAINLTTGVGGPVLDAGDGYISVALDPTTNTLYLASSACAPLLSVQSATTGQFLANLTSPITGNCFGYAPLIFDAVTHTVLAYVPPSGLDIITTSAPATVSSVFLTTSTASNAVFATQMAVDLASGDVLVPDPSDGIAYVVGGSNGMAIDSYATGNFPVGAAYDPVDHREYVANAESDNFTVIDPTNETEDLPLSAGVGPGTVVMAGSTGMALILAQSTDSLILFNVSRGEIVARESPPGGYPVAAVFNASLDEFYVLLEDLATSNASIVAISAPTGNVTYAFPVAAEPNGLAFDPSNGQLYIPSLSTGDVEAYYAGSGVHAASIQLLPRGGVQAYGVTYDPTDGRIIATTSGASNAVEAIDPTNDSAFAAANLTDMFPEGAVVFDPADASIWVAGLNTTNFTWQDVVVSGATLALETTVPTSWLQGEEWAYNPTSEYLYAPNILGNNLTVFNGSTHAVVGYVPVGIEPFGATFDPDSGNIMVTNLVSGTLSEVYPYLPPGPGIVYFDSLGASEYLGGYRSLTLFTQGNSSAFQYTYTGLLPGCTTQDEPFVGCQMTTPGLYEIQANVSDQGGLAAYMTAQVYVEANPAAHGSVPSVSVPVGNRSSIDLGQSVTYSVVASGGSGSYTSYLWTESSPILGCRSSTSATIVCTPTMIAPDLTVTVSVTDSNGSSSVPATSAGLVLYADPQLSTPTPSAVSVVVGDTVTFTTMIVAPGSGRATLSWSVSPAPGLTCPSINLTVVTCTAATAGTYVVTARLVDSNGIPATADSTPFTVTAPVQPPGMYNVTLGEVGLPPGTTWSATIGSSTASSATPWINVTLANGSYDYQVADVGPFEPLVAGNGTLVVSGAPRTIDVSFAYTYDATFQETGLPAGANWGVTVTPTSPGISQIWILAGSTPSLTVALPNASYVYQATATSFPTLSGQATISGAASTFPISWSTSSTAPPSTAPSIPWLWIGLAVVAGVVVIAAVWFLRGRRPPAAPAPPPAPHGNEAALLAPDEPGSQA